MHIGGTEKSPPSEDISQVAQYHLISMLFHCPQCPQTHYLTNIYLTSRSSGYNLLLNHTPLGNNIAVSKSVLILPHYSSATAHSRFSCSFLDWRNRPTNSRDRPCSSFTANWVPPQISLSFFVTSTTKECLLLLTPWIGFSDGH